MIENIIIYSTKDCVYCKTKVPKLEKYLSSKGLHYVLKDVVPDFIPAVPALFFIRDERPYILTGTGMLGLFQGILNKTL